MKKHEQSQPPTRMRVLARVLADQLPRVRVTGGVGPTSVATDGNNDITNLANDNDGPHVPPPV